MKRIAYIFIVVLIALTGTSCSDWFTPAKVEKRMVLLYIAATEASLSPYASGNINDMLAGYVPPKGSKTQDLLVFFQNKDAASGSLRSEAVLSRYYADRSGQIFQEVIANFGEDFNASQPESLAQVLAVAEQTCQPTYRSILISSHGSGWLPPGYFDGGEKTRAVQMSRDDDWSKLSRLKKRESIGYDAPTKDEMEIAPFAAALGKYHWESVLLDCCYMSTIEVAYELRNCCDWIIASPTEILITGFPYSIMLDQLFNQPGKPGLEYICQQYYEMYQAQSGSLKSGTIALIDSKELDALADICASIVSESHAGMNAVQRLAVQHYFYRDSKDFFFDLGHYFEQFTSEERLAEFHEQLDKAVPYKNSTDQFLGIKIEHYSGVSCYIPTPKYPMLNAYYKQLAWNQRVKVIE